MLLIGDVHGKQKIYKKIIDKYDGPTIQLGDYGFKTQHDWHLKNVDCNKHKIVFGNHDYYPYLHKEHSLGDIGILNNGEIVTIRGAISIDKYIRTTGIDWFLNEEMEYAKLKQAIDKIIELKPKIILSHTCPTNIKQLLFGYVKPIQSVTEQAMQCLWVEYQPEIWVFGHFHSSKNEIINNTKFICLNELETFEI